MAERMIDIRGIDRNLNRMLRTLPYKIQGKIVRPALRKSTYRLRQKVLDNLGGRVVREDTGAWRAAQDATGVRALPAKKDVVGTATFLPTRASLGITDDNYYPVFVEYGYTRRKRGRVTVRGFRPLRLAADTDRSAEIAQVSDDIAAALAAHWRTGGL